MTTVLDIIALLPGANVLLRMAMVGGFVIIVALAAEKLGPFLGGMVASLPLFTGPIYLMLALEHDAAYLAASSIGSLAICSANAVFVLAYCIVARRAGTLASLAAAIGAWAVLATIVQSTQWTLIEALLFVAPIYGVSVPLARGFTRGIALRRAARGWYDLPLRAVLCASLAGIVITISAHVPAQLTGVLSVLPILMTSLILVLHPRIGGAATAALLAHTLGGLVGMVLAFCLVNQTIMSVGVWPALALGLATTVLWNLGIIAMRALAARASRSTPQSEPVAAPQPRLAGASLAAPAMPPPLPVMAQPPRAAAAMPPPLPPASRRHRG